MTAVANDERRVVATQRHVAAKVTDETVILHLDDGVYYGLNSVGTRIWEMVQQPTAVSELVSVIAGEFDVDAARCEADVRELLASMETKGLVAWTDVGS